MTMTGYEKMLWKVGVLPLIVFCTSKSKGKMWLHGFTGDRFREVGKSKLGKSLGLYS